MANKKEIQRTEEFRIMVSPEEKELIFEYAKLCGITASQLARFFILRDARFYLMKKREIGA